MMSGGFVTTMQDAAAEAHSAVQPLPTRAASTYQAGPGFAVR